MIPVVERSKARVYGRSLTGITGLNPAGDMDVCLFECCVLPDRGLCEGPIPCPEESYRLWCATECDLETSSIRRPWPALGCCARKTNKIQRKIPTCLHVNGRFLVLWILTSVGGAGDCFCTIKFWTSGCKWENATPKQLRLFTCSKLCDL